MKIAVAYVPSEGTGATPPLMHHVYRLWPSERTYTLGNWIVNSRLTRRYIDFPTEAYEVD